MYKSFEKFEKFANKHKESISVIISVLALFVIVVGYLQVQASFQQVKQIEKQNELYEKQLNLTNNQLILTQEMVNFQYKPQILIEVISPRKTAWFTESGYEEPNFIQIYENDFAKMQTPMGEVVQLGEASFPLKVNFYNFGSVGTKIEKIESFNSCDLKELRSWQMDIMSSRILPPQEKIEYNAYYHHIYFPQRPTNYTFCNYTIVFTFFNDFQIKEDLIIHYNPFNNSFRDNEVDGWYKYVEERKQERLDNQ